MLNNFKKAASEIIDLNFLQIRFKYLSQFCSLN